MLGIAIIGAGRIAKWHAIAVAGDPGGRLVAIVDADLQAAQQFADEFDVGLATTERETVLAMPEVDAVIVCAPTALHHDIALDVIRQGKHVLVEKPFATSLHEVHNMVNAADAAAVKLMSSQTLRFMPMFAWAKAFIQAGNLGTPVQAIERRLTYRQDNFPWWKDLPNFLVSHWGSHSLDLLSYLIDDTVATAVCDGASVASIFGIVDDFNLQLHFAGGTRAGLHMSFSSRHMVHDIVLIGESATLEFTCYKSVSLNGEKVFELPEDQMLADAFSAEIANFVGAINGTAELVSSGRSVISSYAALEAAERSIATGQVEAVA